MVIKTIKEKLSNFNILKNILEYGSIVLFCFYVFSIGAFSGRPIFNYISIAVGIAMDVLMIMFVLIYKKFKIDLFAILLANLIFSFLISSLVNFSFSSFPKSVVTQSIMAFCMYQFFSSINKNRFNLVIPVILLGGICFLCYYFVHYWNDILSFDFNERLGSYFDNENEVGKIFGYLATIAVSYAVFGTKIFDKEPSSLLLATRIACFIIWGLFVVAILSTGSISNLLVTLFLFTIVIFLRLHKNTQKLVFIVIILILISTVILVLQIPELSYFKTRLTNIFLTFINGGEGGDASSKMRLYAMLQYLQLFFLRPLFGFGYGQGKVFTAYNLVAHSSIAELLTCVGLVGFISFEIILIISVLKSFKYKRSVIIVFPLVYVFIFQFFISSIFHAKFEYIFLAISYSLFSNELCFGSLIKKIKDFFGNLCNESSSNNFVEIVV